MHRAGDTGIVGIDHTDETPDVARWLELLADAGYEARRLPHEGELAA